MLYLDRVEQLKKDVDVVAKANDVVVKVNVEFEASLKEALQAKVELDTEFQKAWDARAYLHKWFKVLEGECRS